MGAAAGVAAAGVGLIGHAAYGAGQMVGDFIKDSITAASDLNETLGKSQVVFGSSAKGVEQWGNTAADAFGLSKQKAIEAAASFGNVFKGLDIGAQQSADMSEKLVALAGDLASFNNIDPGDALEKLRSGLAGESEPLRSVGVFLTEAQVKAKAMELGLADAHGELTEGAKILARYHLILDQTKTAQGDFARTTDGLANSQRKANAELEDLQANLGQKMLPAQLAVTKAQSQFFTGLNLVADGLSGKITPDILSYAKSTMGMEGATKLASAALHEMDEDSIHAAVALGLISEAAGQAEIDVRTGAKGTEDSAGKMADDVEKSAAQIKYANDHAGESFKDMARDARLARRDLIGDAQKLVDDYYTVIIDQDQLAATNAEISAQRRIIASRTSSAAEKRDAKSKLHELERTQATLESDLASHGATQSSAFKKTMADLLHRLKTAHGAEKKAIQAEIDALNLLAAKAASSKTAVDTLFGAIRTPGGGTVGRRAAGGPVNKGEPYIVGENHPEVFVPESNGTILPDVPKTVSGGSNGSSSSGGSSSGGVIVVPVPSSWSPAMQQQFARDAAPAMARELRRQGLL